MALFMFSAKQDLLAVVCSSKFRILDCRDGSSKFSCCLSELESLVKEISSKSKTTDPNQELSLALGHGIIASFSPSGQLFALCTGQKFLAIWNTSSWECVIKRKLYKRATGISFTNGEESIIVADKAGEVYRFPTNDSDTKGTLLLGHISMIMDMVLTEDNNFIITADRDEKIRTSHYPNSYNIQSYCLGHSDFVSKICILNQLGILVSGSGDGLVNFWDYQEGRLLHTEKMIGSAQRNTQKDVEKSKEDDSTKSSDVVVFMACCQNNNIICVVCEACCSIKLYHVTKDSFHTLPPLDTSVPPWQVTFDPDGRLWCVQPNPDEPVAIFQAEGEGPETKFSKLRSIGDIPVYRAASEWSYLEECVGKEPRLSLLRKKDVDNMTDYLTKKEERIKQKKKEKLIATSSPAKKIKLQT